MNLSGFDADPPILGVPLLWGLLVLVPFARFSMANANCRISFDTGTFLADCCSANVVSDNGLLRGARGFGIIVFGVAPFHGDLVGYAEGIRLGVVVVSVFIVAAADVGASETLDAPSALVTGGLLPTFTSVMFALTPSILVILPLRSSRLLVAESSWDVYPGSNTTVKT